MKTKIAIPTAISSLRIAALPLFIYLYGLGNVVWCLVLLAVCAASDFFDGYAAKKLDAATRLGAYFDASTDFVITGGIFAFFGVLGLYPIWLPVVIAISFFLFLVTALLAKKLYDPVGRYLGSALYIGIVLTLLWPTPAVFVFVEVAFILFFAVSLISRATSLTRKDSGYESGLV